MAGKINVILLFGGKSTEHEVSVRSARSIHNALDKNKYHVIPVGITKNGSWVRGEEVLHVLKSGSQIRQLSGRTTILPDPNLRQLVNLSGSKAVIPQGDGEDINVVFPVLHGTYGEDGTIQGLLELANIAYVGCNVLSSALGMDKVKQKEIFRQYGIPVVNFLWFKKSVWKSKKNEVLDAIERHFKENYPLFIKPPNNGSSVGITKAHDKKELISGIEVATKYDSKILVEQGMEGTSEIEVSVLGNDDPVASACGEVIPKAEFYDYDAKYIRDDTELNIPADLKPELSDKVRRIACDAFLAMDGSGMARADFFVNKNSNEVWLNELNTIPGFTPISMYPKLWEYSGIPYNKLVDRLIRLGIERWKEKQEIRTSKT